MSVYGKRAVDENFGKADALEYDWIFQIYGSNKVEIEENQWGLGIRILDSQLKRALVISSLFE